MPDKRSMLIAVGKSFAEGATTSNGTITKWIQAVPYDAWDHPIFGMTVFDKTMAETMKINFDNNVRGQDIATDYDHGLDPAKGGKASGWIKQMDPRDDGLWWEVEFTEEASKEISAGEWRYFSPEWYDQWENPMVGGGTYSYVATGGALTNKPWIKGMVPLNFSEVFVEKEVVMLPKYHKFEKDGTEVHWVSDDDGANWRVATEAETTNESVEWEHSEPGTGNPPQPRTDEDDRSGDKDGNGNRREAPPAEPGRPLNLDEEGSMEWTKEELELMGLAEDAKPEDIKSAVALAFSELKPLKDAQKAAEKQKSFSEMYPEEAAELAEARERRVEDNAKKFSEQYESIKDADGKPTGKGFSGLVLSKIVDTHKAFSEGKVKDGMLLFSETLDVMAKDTAIVDYAERGSNRTVDEPVVPTQHKEAVRAFAEAINKVQNDALAEGKTMSYGDALAKAATENPELAKAYSERQTPTA